MTDPTSAPDPEDDLLAELMRRLEAAADREAVLEAFCEEHPGLAATARELAAMNGLLGGGEGVGPDVPASLGGFRILRLIAVGGMGEVYLAEQQSPCRLVALKVIRRGRISEEARGRFLREQEVLARLHQTHIVPIHTAGEEGALQYYVMPYIDGAALSHVLRAAYRETVKQGSRTPTLVDLACRLTQAGEPKPPPAAEGPPPGTASTAPARLPGDGVRQVRDEPSPPRDERLTLSPEYFRSVAELMADVAEAIEHGHACGILHRDIKPSNIMVDRDGRCWIIDFWLAGFLGGEGAAPLPSSAQAAGEPLTMSSVLGTPHYMAPEQINGKADVRADVWGLGVTLIELCTLRRPFDGQTGEDLHRQILAEEPPPARRLVNNVPPDLAAIARKGMRKEPEQRYQAAREVADDLRRWLRGEPTVARPAWPLRRFWLWSRRNKGWAATFIVGVVAGLLLTFAALAVGAAERRGRERAERAAEEQRREVLLQQVLRLRLTAHRDGWSADTWERLRAAARIRPGPDLRDEAAATLGGLDVRKARRFAFPASAVAFNPTGRYLLMGGTYDREASLWDADGDTRQQSGLRGRGPVAFAHDGTPLQFVARTRTTFWLWDVAKKKRIHELAADGESEASPVLAMTPTGSVVAAAVKSRARGVVVALDGTTGKRLRQFAAQAESLALSPDGGLLAAGQADGRIILRPLADGKVVAELQADTLRISCLEFGRDVRQPVRGKDGTGWLLASGDGGGTITVWDLTRKVPRTFCRGAIYRLYHVAFSPDGVTLVSASQSESPRLWDVASGQFLLELSGEANTMTAAGFSADGRRLVTAKDMPASYNPHVQVWDLDFGRGIRTLRGLPGMTVSTTFSPDGKFLAALSSTWRVAIWDRVDDRLLHVLTVPPGYFLDNAGMAFRHDGKRFAFSAGRRVTVWDLATGKEVAHWDLPPGLQDQLAFDTEGKLRSFRYETDLRVCRLRHLSGPRPLDPVGVIPDLKRYIYRIVGTMDGGTFVAEGLGDVGGKPRRWVVVIDGQTGKELWRDWTLTTHPGGTMAVDASGTLFNYRFEDRGKNAWRTVNLRTGARIDTAFRGAMSPGGLLEARARTSQEPALLFRAGEETEILTVDPERLATTGPQFSPDGRFLAVSKQDGTVDLLELREIQRRLAELELGW